MKQRHPWKEIFVSDLSYETTAEELGQLFGLCGTVQSVHLPTNDQGRYKGIAFVRMSSAKETKEAIAMLDGTRLGDRCIKVSEAKTKAERDAAVDPPVAEGRTRRTLPTRPGSSARKKSR